jgi:4-hydroxy 2-oxovalerate aldolase
MYVIDFNFEDSFKTPTIRGLEHAGVEIIECGFLKSGETKPNSSNYGAVTDISQYIAPKKNGVTYIALISDPRDFDIGICPARTESSLDGIRIIVPFFAIEESILLGKQLSEKGYRVFFQLSNMYQYSDDDLKRLLDKISRVKPHGASVVDSQGNTPPHQTMKQLEILENALDTNVMIDFHFHNNLQFALPNTLAVLAHLSDKRAYIIDCSIFGMGQGAGNLPTELIMSYLNKYHNTNYGDGIILELFDKYFAEYYQRERWGYNLEHFVSTNIGCHPFYAKYLFAKLNVTHRELSEILGEIPVEYRLNFNMKEAKKILEKYEVACQ